MTNTLTNFETGTKILQSFFCDYKGFNGIKLYRNEVGCDVYGGRDYLRADLVISSTGGYCGIILKNIIAKAPNVKIYMEDVDDCRAYSIKTAERIKSFYSEGCAIFREGCVIELNENGDAVFEYTLTICEARES